jgi:hypothetical protein
MDCPIGSATAAVVIERWTPVESDCASAKSLVMGPEKVVSHVMNRRMPDRIDQLTLFPSEFRCLPSRQLQFLGANAIATIKSRSIFECPSTSLM